MTLDQIPAGASVFLDANTLIYHFTADPKYGPACARLLKRMEVQDVQGLTSTHALADVAHRLMTSEAMARFGWSATGVAARLRKHHAAIPKLLLAQQSLIKLGQMNLQVLPVSEHQVLSAAGLSLQYELLTGDALIVAVMRHHGLSLLASVDPDFDRVPGLTRYEPA